jgi:hypothetical protein
MPLSETLAVLIINNSFILAGALIKYIGSSECMKFMCCRGGIEIRDLHHAHMPPQGEEQIGTMVITPTGEAKM